MAANLEHLQHFSIIGKVVNDRPSRGELQNLLQGKLVAEVGKIRDIRIFNRGFYRVGFEEHEAGSHNSWLISTIHSSYQSSLLVLVSRV